MTILLPESTPNQNDSLRTELIENGVDTDVDFKANKNFFKGMPSLDDMITLFKISSVFSGAAIVAFFNNLGDVGLHASILYYLRDRFDFSKDQFANLMVIIRIVGTASQWLDGFNNSKKFVISSCVEMKEIFTTDDNTSTGISSATEGTNASSIILPSLQLIKLEDLPRLKLYSARNRRNPDARSTFFGEQVEFPELKMLRMERLHSCEEIWESHLPVGSFGQLRELVIAYCDELRCIFSAAVARCLVQLRELAIKGCSKLEEVVVIECVHADKQEENKITFPRLNKIHLCYARSLHSFCSARNSIWEFSALKEIEIAGNSNMQVFSYGFLHTPKLTGRDPLYGDDLNTYVARVGRN